MIVFVSNCWTAVWNTGWRSSGREGEGRDSAIHAVTCVCRSGAERRRLKKKARQLAREHNRRVLEMRQKTEATASDELEQTSCS